MAGLKFVLVVSCLVVCCKALKTTEERKRSLEYADEKYDGPIRSAVLSDEEIRVLKTLHFYDEARMRDDNEDCKGKTDVHHDCEGFIKQKFIHCQTAFDKEMCGRTCCKYNADPCYIVGDRDGACDYIVKKGRCNEKLWKIEYCRASCAGVTCGGK